MFSARGGNPGLLEDTPPRPPAGLPYLGDKTVDACGDQLGREGAGAGRRGRPASWIERAWVGQRGGERM
jgi:hypothetical protein